jgi:hypothetical protein
METLVVEGALFARGRLLWFDNALVVATLCSEMDVAGVSCLLVMELMSDVTSARSWLHSDEYSSALLL